MTRNPYRNRPMIPKTRTRRLQMERLMLEVHNLQEDQVYDYWVQSQVPEAWDTLERDIDVDEPKEKITLYLDRSVARFFRAMGKGYHDRINRILATFAQMRIANIKRLEEMFEEEMEKIERHKMAFQKPKDQ